MTQITVEADPAYIDSRASAVVQAALAEQTIRRTIGTPAPEANREFSIQQDQFNLPQDGGYQNIVQRWGYNVDRANTSEPSGHISIESKYLLNNVGPYVMEFHIEGKHADGTPWRMFSSIEPVDQSDADTGSSAGFNTQIFQLATKSGSQRIKWDWVAGHVFYLNTQLHRIGVNNVPFWQQLNAAGNDYLSYPYFDNTNRYYVPALNVRFDGALSVGGDATCQSLKLAFEKSIDFAHPTLGQNNQFTLRQTDLNVLSLRANTNAGFDINATSGRATSRGIMSVNDPSNTIANNGVGTQLSVLGSLGLYTGTSNNGAAIYLGDSNFRASAYWDAAPGFRAIDTGQGIASGLGIYTYTGPNSRTMAIEVSHQQYVKCTSRFACNGNTPQAKQSVNAAASDPATTQALVNQLRTALINVGICV